MSPIPQMVEEAIANALMYRDHSLLPQDTPVQIDLYVDCLEIINPGGLCGNVTISSFKLTFERRRLTKSETELTSSEAVRAVIMGMFKEQVSVSSSEVARASGRAKGTVLKQINRMIEEGVLEPTKPKGSSRQRYRRADMQSDSDSFN